MAKQSIKWARKSFYCLNLAVLTVGIFEIAFISNLCSSQWTTDLRSKATAPALPIRYEHDVLDHRINRNPLHSVEDCSVLETVKEPWKNEYDISLACFVITMPSRCANVTARFARLGLPCTMVKGVTPDEIANIPERPINKRLRPTQIAAYHSHRKALQRFLDVAATSTVSHALILEDDIEMPSDIKPYTLRRLELLNTFDPLWDMLYLFYTYEEREFEDEAIIPGLDLYKAQYPRAAAAYIVPTEAAASLLSISRKQRMPIDELFSLQIHKKLIRAFITAPSRLTHIRSYSTILINHMSPQRRYRNALYSCCCKHLDIETVQRRNDICILKEKCKWNEFDLNCMHVFSRKWRESNCRASCAKASMQMCGEQRHDGSDPSYKVKNEEEPGNYTNGCSAKKCFESKPCTPVGLPGHSGIPIETGTEKKWHMKDYEWYGFNGVFSHYSETSMHGNLQFSYETKNIEVWHNRKTAFKKRSKPIWSVLPGSGRFNMIYLDDQGKPEDLESLPLIWKPSFTEEYYQFPVLGRNQMEFSDPFGENCKQIILSHRHYTFKGVMNKTGFYGEFWERADVNLENDPQGHFHVTKVKQAGRTL